MAGADIFFFAAAHCRARMRSLIIGASGVANAQIAACHKNTTFAD